MRSTHPPGVCRCWADRQDAKLPHVHCYVLQVTRITREARSVMRVSVIIPTLNEATTIVQAIRRLKTQDCAEIIVADAISNDGTADLARREGVVVVDSPSGRGVQQNHGAAGASEDLLLFLHADCRLEDGAIAVLCHYL